METAGLGRGVYSGPEAARLSRLRGDRIARWLRGYEFKTKTGEKGRSEPVFKPDWPSDEGSLTLSFLDLVEVLFVRAFLDHGVSMRTIRQAAIEGVKLFNDNHPFCLKRFETDGQRVFANIAEQVNDEHIIDLVTKQAVFKQVIRPLFRQIDYDVAGELAAVWWPRGRDFPVLLDPRRAFGSPIVAKRGVPTHVLAGPVEAGDSPAAVARWFEVTVEEVEAAVEFERSLRPAA